MERSTQADPVIRRVLVFMAVLLGLAFASLVLRYISYVLLLVFAGVLFAIFLHGTSITLSTRFHVPQNLALGGTLATLASIIVVLVVAGGPQITTQAIQLTERIPAALEQLRALLSQWELGRRILAMANEPQRWWPIGSNLIQRLPGVFSTAVGGVLNIVIIFFLGIYLSINPSVYINGGLHLIVKKKRARIREVLAATKSAVWRWLFARFLSMAAVGILTTIGLLIAGIPLALALGLIAAVLSFVPYLGPILSFVPAALVALSGEIIDVLWVAIVYAIVQFFESYLITPLIEQQATSVPAAVLISFQLLLGVTAGAMGIFLATPLLVMVIVLIQMLYVQDILGDKIQILGNVK